MLTLAQAPDPVGLLQITDYSDMKIEKFSIQIRKVKPARMVLYDVLEYLNLDILRWQKSSMSLEKMLMLSEARFLAKQKDLVDCAHWLFGGKRDVMHLGQSTIRGRELLEQIEGEDWPYIIVG